MCVILYVICRHTVYIAYSYHIHIHISVMLYVCIYVVDKHILKDMCFMHVCILHACIYISMLHLLVPDAPDNWTFK